MQGQSPPPPEEAHPGGDSPTIEDLLERVTRLEAEREGTTAPAWLEGWHFHVIATEVVQWSTGADAVTGNGSDETRSTTSFDLELARPFDHGAGEIYLSLEAGIGDGLDGVLGLGTATNGDAIGDSDLGIFEAWTRYGFDDGRWVVHGGRLDLTGTFDANAVANDERFQFLAGAFVNAATFAVPDPSLAVQLCRRWGEDGEATVAVADPGTSDDPFHQPFVIGQVAGGAHFGRVHTRGRVYIFRGADAPLVLDATRRARSNGWGISADAALDPDVHVFFRYGEQDPEVAAIERAWSGGVVASGAAWGRPDDDVALAFASHGFGAETRATTAGSSGHERIIELQYRGRISDALELTPDLQWIENPGGRGHAASVTVVGVRLGLRF